MLASGIFVSLLLNFLLMFDDYYVDALNCTKSFKFKNGGFYPDKNEQCNTEEDRCFAISCTRVVADIANELRKLWYDEFAVYGCLPQRQQQTNDQKHCESTVQKSEAWMYDHYPSMYLVCGSCMVGAVNEDRFGANKLPYPPAASYISCDGTQFETNLGKNVMRMENEACPYDTYPEHTMQCYVLTCYHKMDTTQYVKARGCKRLQDDCKQRVADAWFGRYTDEWRWDRKWKEARATFLTDFKCECTTGDPNVDYVGNKALPWKATTAISCDGQLESNMNWKDEKRMEVKQCPYDTDDLESKVQCYAVTCYNKFDKTEYVKASGCKLVQEDCKQRLIAAWFNYTIWGRWDWDQRQRQHLADIISTNFVCGECITGEPNVNYTGKKSLSLPEIPSEFTLKCYKYEQLTVLSEPNETIVYTNQPIAEYCSLERCPKDYRFHAECCQQDGICYNGIAVHVPRILALLVPMLMMLVFELFCCC